MSFWTTLGQVMGGLGKVMSGCEQASLMAAARAEPNPIVRQQKIQMVLQLPTVTDHFVRGQMVSEIIKRS